VRRTLAGGLIAGLLLTVALSGPAAMAGTRAQSTSCNLSTIVTFDPGLGLSQAQQKITAKGKLTQCNGGGVTKAKFKGKGGGSLSCTSGTGTITLKVKWNTKETSKVSLTVDLGNQSLSGSVISGKFAGEDVTVSNVTFTILSGDCVFQPVTKAQVTGTAGL
jgi:hypothetical protein